MLRARLVCSMEPRAPSEMLHPSLITPATKAISGRPSTRQPALQTWEGRWGWWGWWWGWGWGGTPETHRCHVEAALRGAAQLGGHDAASAPRTCGNLLPWRNEAQGLLKVNTQGPPGPPGITWVMTSEGWRRGLVCQQRWWRCWKG